MKYEKYIFVDFENINSLDLAQLNAEKHKLYMLVGSVQNRLPFDIIKQAHEFAESLEWIKVEGTGKNDLDMHFSFLLGECHRTADKSIEFLIYAKDKDHSSKVNFIKSQGRSCRKLRNFDITEVENNFNNNTQKTTNGDAKKDEYFDKLRKDELKPMKIVKTFSDFDAQ